MNQALSIILSLTLPFLMTVFGASLVFFFNKTSKFINTLTIGLASGIMLSASIFSLLIPSLENAETELKNLAPIPVVCGFALGGIFMILLDFIVSKIKINDENEQKSLNNSKKHDKTQHFLAISKRKKTFKLFSAITIHNIPEGLSVGFSIGTAVAMQTGVFSALMFAIGIALQNFPEGLATSLPIYNCIENKKKSFFLGALSGIVEPIFAIAGFFLATSISFLLPWLLSFSAGAMIYVVIEELLPEIHFGEKSSFGTWAFLLGFILMMILDICL